MHDTAWQRSSSPGPRPSISPPKTSVSPRRRMVSCATSRGVSTRVLCGGALLVATTNVASPSASSSRSTERAACSTSSACTAMRQASAHEPIVDCTSVKRARPKFFIARAAAPRLLAQRGRTSTRCTRSSGGGVAVMIAASGAWWGRASGEGRFVGLVRSRRWPRFGASPGSTLHRARPCTTHNSSAPCAPNSPRRASPN
jgi:hypothetical protein